MRKRYVIKVVVFGLLCVGIGVLLPLFIPGIAEKYRFWQKTYRLRRAIAADPSDIQSYNSLLLEYYTHGPGYDEQIIAIHEKLLELKPNEANACLSLAGSLVHYKPKSQSERETRDKKICELVDKAISLSSKKDILVYGRAGDILSMIGEDDKAREYLQYALSHFRGDTAAVELISAPYREQLEASLRNLGEKERILDSLKQHMNTNDLGL
jgi:tetratricopeptide (TPR) repeat protein